jgi:hypothetical protein
MPLATLPPLRKSHHLQLLKHLILPDTLPPRQPLDLTPRTALHLLFRRTLGHQCCHTSHELPVLWLTSRSTAPSPKMMLLELEENMGFRKEELVHRPTNPGSTGLPLCHQRERSRKRTIAGSLAGQPARLTHLHRHQPNHDTALRLLPLSPVDSPVLQLVPSQDHPPFRLQAVLGRITCRKLPLPVKLALYHLRVLKRSHLVPFTAQPRSQWLLRVVPPRHTPMLR